MSVGIAVDEAILEALAPLNDPSWHVHHFERTSMGTDLSGREVIVTYTIVIKNDKGVQATGDGYSIGVALSDAIDRVQSQAAASAMWRPL